MEFMEIWLIPSDCRFSVWGTRIQLLVMVFVYIICFLWNHFLLIAIQIDIDDSHSYCKVVRGLLSGGRETHLTHWSGSGLHGTFWWHKLNHWQSVNCEQRVWKAKMKKVFFKRAQHVDWEKHMRGPVKLIDQIWYNMEALAGRNRPKKDLESVLFYTCWLLFFNKQPFFAPCSVCV